MKSSERIKIFLIDSWVVFVYTLQKALEVRDFMDCEVKTVKKEVGKGKR